MLTSLKTVLEKARKERYAVLAVNCFNFETVRATINAAEELKAPIIINLFQGHIDRNISFENISVMVKKLDKDVEVPVVLNLDHGRDFKNCKEALENGFTGVMIDASKELLNKNIEFSLEVTKEAEKHNAGVEGELGHMGNADDYNHNHIVSLSTNIEEVEEYIEKSQVDALAISCGTAHGLYGENIKPKIDFQLIESINKISKVPLVMHGGSGIVTEDLKKAISCGISKVNVGADIFNAGKAEILNKLSKNPTIELSELILDMEEAYREEVKSYILETNSNNKI